MIYGLVIVTSLGAATLLGTFSDRFECLREQAMISKGPNSQAQCWPGPDENSLKERVTEINKTVSTKVVR
jgi:hypothetical protein